LVLTLVNRAHFPQIGSSEEFVGVRRDEPAWS